MKLRRFTCLLVVTLLIQACATYQPPTLPPEQLAIVVPPDRKFGNFLFIERIDGLPPSAGAAMGLGMSQYNSPVGLAPGKHTMKIRVGHGLSHGYADIWLVAEAGKTYRIAKESKGYTFRVWFVEDSTGKQVGGVVGSEDEPQ
jgi:hypothetical protein